MSFHIIYATILVHAQTQIERNNASCDMHFYREQSFWNFTTGKENTYPAQIIYYTMAHRMLMEIYTWDMQLIRYLYYCFPYVIIKLSLYFKINSVEF